MVWENQEQLAAARKRGMTDVGTLFGMAKVANVGKVDNITFVSEAKADPGLIRITQDGAVPVVGDPQIMSDVQTALLLSSLPETYAYTDIALLLERTRRLLNSTKQRTGATNAVMSLVVQGLAAGDTGFGFHSAFTELGLRHERISRDNGNIPGGVIPYINQVSLAYTLLTFSYTPFQAMERAGKPMPDAPVRQAWLAMWDVVGSLMGIEQDGRPVTIQEAGRLLQVIQDSPQYAPPYDQSAHDLTNALIDAFSTNPGDRQGFITWTGAGLMGRMGIT